MKKILLTLIAVAAVFVACDKDAYDQEVMNINVIEQDIKVDALNEVKSILNGLDLGESLYAPSVKINKSNLTARTSTAADCHDNRPDAPNGKKTADFQFLPISGGNQGWFVIRGTGNIPLELNRPIVRFLVGTSSEDIQLQLHLQNASGDYVTMLPLGTTPYSAAIDAVFAAADFLSVDKADVYLDSVTPNVEETASDAGIACSAGTPASSWSSSTANGVTTWTHPTLGSFTIEGAPFPLSGFLATMGTNDSGNTVRNYAGTTSSSVYDAITGDYDGN